MTGQPTYAEIRHVLGFGVRRLKLLLVLVQHPELDEPQWHGTLTCFLGGGMVKYDLHEGKRPAPREVSLEDAA